MFRRRRRENAAAMETLTNNETLVDIDWKKRQHNGNKLGSDCCPWLSFTPRGDAGFEVDEFLINALSFDIWLSNLYIFLYIYTSAW